MHRQTIELTKTPAAVDVKNPGGIILTASAKAGLLVLLLGLLYLRLWRRKRAMDSICAHCGHRNPVHRTSCSQCSAPTCAR